MPPGKDVDPCDLTHASNMGIAVAYFTVGMTMSFITNPLNIYLVNTLNAEPDLQGTINILQTLPWSLKIIVGFMSDAIPCFGMHRKPYLVAGTAIYGLSWLFYADLEESGGGSLWMLSIVVFVSTMGLIIIDVMADTMTVERSKFEPDVIKGQMQATCYSCRFGGGVLGAVLGTIFTQQDWSIGLSFVQICQLNGYLGILVLPFCVFLKEKYKKSEVPVRILTQLSPSKGAAGDGSGGYGFSAVQVQEDVSLNKAVASSSYQYGYVPAQRRVSNVNELELIEKGQMQAYLTTPIKPTKRFGGFQESAKMGEWGFDASASKRLSGGGGSTVMKALSPFRSKTPRQSASDKGYSRGPQSTNKKNMSKGEAMSEGVDAAQEDTPLIVPNPSSSLKMGGSYTEEQPQPRSSSSGRKALTINTGDDANSESGEPSSGRGSAATNILSPSFHFGASPLVYTLDPAANNSNSNRSGNQAVPSPHIHVLTESDLDMTMESMNSSGSTADYAGMFSPGAIIEGERLQRQEEEEEEEEEATIPVSKQISDIWATVQLKAVWRPMAFVYIFNLLQVPNVAWQSYLQLTLHFESWVLGLSVLFGSIMTFVGILIYKYYLFNVTWKSIYIWSCFLTGAFSLMQLVLIFQINKTYLHMGNYFFSLGDDVITAYIAGIQFLPVCIMYMKLCPDGAEGASYAILTTFGNIALVCANSLGNVVSKIWNVSNTALREGDINGLWRLSLLTSIVPLAPLALLFLLPQTKDEQHALGQSKTRSKIGGACFLIVLAASLAYCINHSMQELLSAYASAGIVNTEPPVYTSHHNDGHRPHHHFA